MSLNDIFGKEVAIYTLEKYGIGTYTKQISVNALSNGIYILHYLNNNKIISSIKVIVYH